MTVISHPAYVLYSIEPFSRMLTTKIQDEICKNKNLLSSTMRSAQDVLFASYVHPAVKISNSFSKHLCNQSKHFENYITCLLSN